MIEFLLCLVCAILAPILGISAQRSKFWALYHLYSNSAAKRLLLRAVTLSPVLTCFGFMAVCFALTLFLDPITAEDRKLLILGTEMVGTIIIGTVSAERNVRESYDAEMAKAKTNARLVANPKEVF